MPVVLKKQQAITLKSYNEFVTKQTTKLESFTTLLKGEFYEHNILHKIRGNGKNRFYTC
jgi:hypothetical protein